MERRPTSHGTAPRRNRRSEDESEGGYRLGDPLRRTRSDALGGLQKQTEHDVAEQRAGNAVKHLRGDTRCGARHGIESRVWSRGRAALVLEPDRLLLTAGKVGYDVAGQQLLLGEQASVI
jgi:hypothetical protein